jgi:hypothetical protein
LHQKLLPRGETCVKQNLNLVSIAGATTRAVLLSKASPSICGLPPANPTRVGLHNGPGSHAMDCERFRLRKAKEKLVAHV